jgi:hypothetical protein
VELNSKDKTPLQIANLRSLVKELCPKKCAQGLLFFGLRHEVVQNKNYPGSVFPGGRSSSSSSLNTTPEDKVDAPPPASVKVEETEAH